MTLAEVLALLDGVRGNNGQRTAHCPAHDDRTASLSVSEGRDGRVLLRCHAGCETRAVCSAIGLTERDLFSARAAEPPRERRIVAEYNYSNANGDLLYQVVRFEPKDFRQRRPDGRGGWMWNMNGIERVLYHLTEVIEAIAAERTIYVVEGEKSADALRERGLSATCSPGGAGKWRDEYNAYFAAANVVLLPDNDEPGRAHAEHVAGSLSGTAASVKMLALPDLPEKGDVYDWLAAGRSVDDLQQLAAAVPEWTPGTSAPEVERPPRKTQSTLVLELTADWVAFKTPDGEQWVTTDNGEHVPVKSHMIRDELARRFAEEYERAPNSSALVDVVNVLAGRAQRGETHPVFRRVAEVDGRIVVDLADDARRAVIVTPHGWTEGICPTAVHFYRPAGMRPLPAPERGGSVEQLRRLVNVRDDDAFTLLVAWLLSALRTTGSRPVLSIQGPQGSAKSTLARNLVQLVDPSSAPLRSPPRDEYTIAVAAKHAHILAIDNLSNVPDWLSDVICRMATGGALSSRQLYTDFDEVRLELKRSIIITSIESVVTRGDLADRAVTVMLTPIADAERRDEAALDAEFAAATPRIIGALFDAVAVGLRDLPTTRLDNMPRMADFAKWTAACETGLGWERGRFIAAYTFNRTAAAEQAVEFDPVAQTIQTLATEGGWNGTVGELLLVLNERVDESLRRLRDWPSTPRKLSNKLKRITPDLQRLGVQIETGERVNAGRLIRIGTGPSW